MGLVMLGIKNLEKRITH